MFDELNRFLDSFSEVGIPGFVMRIYHNGEEVFYRTGGYSDYENKVSVNGDELFNLYSCTKTVTVTALMQLYEKGLFKLSDNLCDYMPEFTCMSVQTENGLSDAKNKIKIEDLFSMTAGFSYELDSPAIRLGKQETNGICATGEMMKYIAKEPLLFEPGERYNYSLCHDVLAGLAEVLTGEKFGNYVSKNILEPLGMENSGFSIDNKEYICAQYRYNDELKKYEKVSKDIQGYKFGKEYESGGAGLISTNGDFIKFAEALRTHKLIKEETTDLITSDRIEGRRGAYSFDAYGYGLGMRCPRKGSDATDFGWGGAAGSYMTVDRINSLTVCYNQHVLFSPIHNIRNKFIDIIKRDLRI